MIRGVHGSECTQGRLEAPSERLCARVSFSLPPSAYATMALRQLLRSSSTDLEKVDSGHAHELCDQQDDEQGSSGTVQTCRR